MQLGNNNGRLFEFENTFFDNPKPYDFVNVWQIGELSLESGYEMFAHPLADSLNEKNKNQFQVIAKLLDCFGKADATALDYWMDNSLFSGWKKPPALFNLDVPVLCADAKMYAGFGFEYITSFACYLGPDYVETHNVMPPIKDFAECLNKIK